MKKPRVSAPVREKETPVSVLATRKPEELTPDERQRVEVYLLALSMQRI